MAKVKTQDHVQSVRATLSEWVSEYISQRRVKDRWCGEFIGPDEVENGQFGLGGSTMVSFLERDLGLTDTKYHLVFQRIFRALDKQQDNPEQLNEDEAKLIKDIDRAIVKAILLALAEDDLDPQPILERLLNNVDSDGLFRSIQDDNKSGGDAMITAIVIIFVHIAGRQKGNLDALAGPKDKLKDELSKPYYDLYQKLIISNALCLIDYNENIWRHRRLLDSLYVSDLDWWRTFSSSFPFTERLYSDAPVKDNRYLKIPNGFTVLLAIYLAVGSEKRLHRFPPSERLLADIRSPFGEHVGRDKGKASVYYVWYTYIALNLDSFFGGRKVLWVSYAAQFVLYKIRNLTIPGILILLALLFSGTFLAYSAYQALYCGFDSQAGNIVSALGIAVSSFLGLFKTSRR